MEDSPGHQPVLFRLSADHPHFQTGIEIQEILHTGFYLYGWKRSLELTRLLRSQGYIINSSGSQKFTIPLQLPSKIEIT